MFTKDQIPDIRKALADRGEFSTPAPWGEIVIIVQPEGKDYVRIKGTPVVSLTYMHPETAQPYPPVPQPLTFLAYAVVVRPGDDVAEAVNTVCIKVTAQVGRFQAAMENLGVIGEWS